MLTLRSSRPLTLIGWLLAQACSPAASLPAATPPDPQADPPVAAASAADLPPPAAAPKRPLVALCPGAPTRFEHRYASGPVGPGHRAATVTTGEIQGQTVFLTYTWSGDTRPIDGRPGHSELTWEATLTGEEAAAWHAALAEPLLEPREIDPRSTGGSQTTLRIDHGACTRFGEPDAAWSARVGALQARAAEGLPFDERVALGVASDAVIVELADASRGQLVCGAEGRSATSVAGRLRFADVPAGACTLSAPPLSGDVTTYRGDRLACAADGGRLTCSVKAPGDRPAPE